MVDFLILEIFHLFLNIKIKYLQIRNIVINLVEGKLKIQDNMSGFKLTSKYKPLGDQPKAIDSLVNGLNDNQRDQSLLGITGSGKLLRLQT